MSALFAPTPTDLAANIEGPRAQIVGLLESYRQGLAVDFLAYAINQSRAQVERYLIPLMDAGLLERSGDLVRLTSKGATQLG